MNTVKAENYSDEFKKKVVNEFMEYAENAIKNAAYEHFKFSDVPQDKDSAVQEKL